MAAEMIWLTFKDNKAASFQRKIVKQLKKLRKKVHGPRPLSIAGYWSQSRPYNLRRYDVDSTRFIVLYNILFNGTLPPDFTEADMNEVDPLSERLILDESIFAAYYNVTESLRQVYTVSLEQKEYWLAKSDMKIVEAHFDVKARAVKSVIVDGIIRNETQNDTGKNRLSLRITTPCRTFFETLLTLPNLQEGEQVSNFICVQSQPFDIIAVPIKESSVELIIEGSNVLVKI